MERFELQSPSQQTNENIFAQELFSIELMQEPPKPLPNDADWQPFPSESKQSMKGQEIGAFSLSQFNFEELSLTLEKTFKRIDKDQDGFLTYAELAEAVRDPSFKGKEAVVLAVLKSGQIDQQLNNGISNLVDDSDPGVSLKDAKAYFGLLRMAQQSNCSVDTLCENMAKAFANKEFKELLFGRSIETDVSKFPFLDPWSIAALKVLSVQDQRVSETRLIEASRSDKLGSVEKSVIHVMLRNREFLCGLEPNDKDPNSISIFDLERFRTMAKTASLFERQTWGMIHRRATSPDPSSKLFAPHYKPIESIKPSAVRQGSIGSCFLLGAVGTLAAHDPERLRKMITTTESGGYRVKFPGAEGKEVIVDAPTETELLLYAGATKYGTWVAVLEKAYARLLLENPEYRPPVYNRGAWPPENLDAGGLYEAFEVLTGTFSEPFEIGLSPRHVEALRKRLVLGKKNGEMAIAVTARDKSVRSNLTPGHVYTVLDYDDKFVTLRNPWGVTRIGEKAGLPLVDEADSGVIRMPLEEFCQNFQTIILTPKLKPAKE